MQLAEYGEDLVWEVAVWYTSFTNPALPISELGELSLEVSRGFRVLGIVTLLTQGDSDLFYDHLVRAGRVRLDYLQRLQAAGVAEDHHRASGRVQPLLSAIAAGDLDLARLIADLSPRDFLPLQEYEDDYCFSQIVHEMIQEKPNLPRANALLERLELTREEDREGRLAVSRALLLRDQELFEEGLLAFLLEYELAIQADKDRSQMEEAPIVAERRTSVEALALLRLAELHGLRTEEDYVFCPSCGRVPRSRPFPGE